MSTIIINRAAVTVSLTVPNLFLNCHLKLRFHFDKYFSEKFVSYRRPTQIFYKHSKTTIPTLAVKVPS